MAQMQNYFMFYAIGLVTIFVVVLAHNLNHNHQHIAPSPAPTPVVSPAPSPSQYSNAISLMPGFLVGSFSLMYLFVLWS